LGILADSLLAAARHRCRYKVCKTAATWRRAMHISASVREYALIQICRDYRTDWPGARLRIGDFADAWKGTGLREADLAQALQDLLAAGVFRGRPLSLESELELTPVGAERLDQSPSGLEGFIERLLLRRTLERARRRVPAGRRLVGSAQSLARRRSDQARVGA
jgi:hypothetical protein